MHNKCTTSKGGKMTRQANLSHKKPSQKTVWKTRLQQLRSHLRHPLAMMFPHLNPSCPHTTNMTAGQVPSIRSYDHTNPNNSNPSAFTSRKRVHSFFPQKSPAAPAASLTSDLNSAPKILPAVDRTTPHLPNTNISRKLAAHTTPYHPNALYSPHKNSMPYSSVLPDSSSPRHTTGNTDPMPPPPPQDPNQTNSFVPAPGMRLLSPEGTENTVYSHDFSPQDLPPVYEPITTPYQEDKTPHRVWPAHMLPYPNENDSSASQHTTHGLPPAEPTEAPSSRSTPKLPETPITPDQNNTACTTFLPVARPTPTTPRKRQYTPLPPVAPAPD